MISVGFPRKIIVNEDSQKFSYFYLFNMFIVNFYWHIFSKITVCPLNSSAIQYYNKPLQVDVEYKNDGTRFSHLFRNINFIVVGPYLNSVLEMHSC